MTISTPVTGDPAVSGQADASTADDERADLLATLAKNRHFLCFTTRGLTDEQAGQRTTVSELCLGGLIKHVTAVEQGWVDFIVAGPAAMKDATAMTEEDEGSGLTSSGRCPARRWPPCWPTTPRWPTGPTNWLPACPA